MKELSPEIVSRSFADAKALYAQWGVDVEQALRTLASIPLSIHCWQGDDVHGYEETEVLGGQGVQTTGSYPGRARTADELRADFQTAAGLIPGSHRFALHANYAETGGKKVGRDRIGPEHFARWMSWAKETGIKLDFNQTFFNHPLADSGFTLSSRDPKIRKFWVEHAMRCREIGEAMGRAQGSPCVVNLWIQDGYKDTPADRFGPRQILKQSLDEVFARKMDPREELDTLEGKLFGVGTESYVVGSHEFYIGYALKNDLIITLDTGHYPSHGDRDGQDLLAPPLREGAVPAREPRHPLGQRPRRHPGRRAEGPCRGAGPGGRVGQGAHRHGFLRREHQQDRRLGDRGTLHAARASHRAARAGSRDPRGRAGGQPHGAPRPAGGGEEPSLRRGLGRVLPAREGCPSARRGSRRWPSTRRRCSRRGGKAVSWT